MLLWATPSLQGASLVFAASLSGAAEDPPVASTGPGLAAGTYDRLFELTDPASFNPSFLAGAGGGTAAGAEAALAAALIEGKAYLNIHSTYSPSGEIRGFLVRSVPEPVMGMAGVWLFLGFVGVSALRRKG